MKKFGLIIALFAILTSGAAAQNQASTGFTGAVAIIQSPPSCQPVVAAGVFRWLDELINGSRSARHLPGQAYRYSQREDRRGGEHGFLYYLAVGIWRFAAGAGAAAIAGKAIGKQNVSAQTKNIVVLAPFVVGLFLPLFALFGAGIIWLACKEENAEPPANE